MEQIIALDKPEDYARWLIACVVAGELLSNVEEREALLSGLTEPTSDDPEEFALYLSQIFAAGPDSDTDDLESYDRMKSRLATLPATPWIVSDN